MGVMVAERALALAALPPRRQFRAFADRAWHPARPPAGVSLPVSAGAGISSFKESWPAQTIT
jgi:hypothetical protein